MSAERPCPACHVPGRSARGDLVRCSSCGTEYFAPPWQDEALPLLPPEAAPLPAWMVFAFHAGVLAAELLLAALVVSLFLALPAAGVAWLCGALPAF